MLYFFNVAGAEYDPDKEGVELPTLDDARRMAVLFASEMMRDHPTIVWSGEEFRVEVTNAEQSKLFTVIVVGVDSPSVPMADAQLPLA